MVLLSRLSAGTLFLALSSLALSARSVRADVLFSTLPFARSGTGIGGETNNSLGYLEVAFQFTPSATAHLDSIEIPFFLSVGDSNPLTVSLYTSVNNLPGDVLASQIIPANTIVRNVTSLQTLNFGGAPVLTAGTSYFVDAATTGNSVYGWVDNQSNTRVPGAYRDRPGGAFTTYNFFPGAFQVNGTPVRAVPEPGSVALLLGIGVSGMGLLARRKRKSAFVQASQERGIC